LGVVLTRTSTILLEGLKDLSNRSAWQAFDWRYRPLLMAVARRLGLRGADAEDAVQETLAAFVVDYNAGRYQRDTGRLRDWLSGIMTHKVRDLQRRGHRGGDLIRNPVHIDTLEQIEDNSIHDAMKEEHDKAALRECVDAVRREVSPQMFDSFDLFALQQWPAQKVAQQLGISADAVYQNKRRVLQRIRERLPEIEDRW
jgi:RNA polymerase sigma factor (sigma-70 family)